MTVAGLAPGPVTTPPQPTALVPNSQPSSGGLSFGDILDTINPLQHIPILSGLYRAATGSQISPVAEIAGNVLYGALIPGGAVAGLASSVADVAVKEATGSDIGQMVLNAISGSSSAAASAATPLVAGTQAPGNITASSPNPNAPSPFINLGLTSQASNAQYQRAQAFDALNAKLVKMAV